MLENILLALLAWFCVACMLSVFVGAFIHFTDRRGTPICGTGLETKAPKNNRTRALQFRAR